LFSKGSEDIEHKNGVKYVQELSSLSNNYIQVMNCIVRRCLAMMNLTQLGRGYFDPKNRVKILNILIVDLLYPENEKKFTSVVTKIQVRISDNVFKKSNINNKNQ
jgi:hypothetical protein